MLEVKSAPPLRYTPAPPAVSRMLLNTTFGPDDWHKCEYSYQRVMVRPSKVAVFSFAPLNVMTLLLPCLSIFVTEAPPELRTVIDLSLIDSVSL